MTNDRAYSLFQYAFFLSGSAIGALSVADRRPRSLTDRQLESLQRLARQISRELRLRDVEPN